jgi:glycosyltransferase involved in cell wall biosynthesis
VLPFYLRQPAVVTIHDVGHREQRSSYSPSAWLYLEAMTRWMAKRARFLVAVSQHTANQLQRFYDVPGERLAVIHSGVDPNMRPQPREEVERVKRSYALSLPYFLYVGRNHPRKNLPLLAQAFGRVREQGLQVEMVLAGAEGFPGQPGLKVLPYVPEADLPGLYSGSIALTLPSRFEGFGFPVLEAMGCETAVIASNAGALPEIVGEAGILLSPVDRGAWIAAMLELAQNDALRASLVERGRKHSAAFNWERTADSLWQVLDQAAASR